MHSSDSTPSPQRPSLYPWVWVFYLIALVAIARCFETPDDIATLPSDSISHLAAVFGLPTFDIQACSGDCGQRPLSSVWSRPVRFTPSNSCSDIPTNPDLQAGCGFAVEPVSGPAPSADLSATPSDELPAPPTDTMVATFNPGTPTHGFDDASALP